MRWCLRLPGRRGHGGAGGARAARHAGRLADHAAAEAQPRGAAAPAAGRICAGRQPAARAAQPGCAVLLKRCWFGFRAGTGAGLPGIASGLCCLLKRVRRSHMQASSNQRLSAFHAHTQAQAPPLFVASAQTGAGCAVQSVRGQAERGGAGGGPGGGGEGAGVQVRLAALASGGRDALTQTFLDVQLGSNTPADLWHLAGTGKFRAAAGAGAMAKTINALLMPWCHLRHLARKLWRLWCGRPRAVPGPC